MSYNYGDKTGSYDYSYLSSFTWTIELNRDLFWCYQKSCEYSLEGYKKRLRTYWLEIHPELNHLSAEQLCKQAKFIEQKRMFNSNYDAAYYPQVNTEKNKYDLVKEKSREKNVNNERIPTGNSSRNVESYAWNVLPGQQSVASFRNDCNSSAYPERQVYQGVSNYSGYYAQNQQFSTHSNSSSKAGEYGSMFSDATPVTYCNQDRVVPTTQVCQAQMKTVTVPQIDNYSVNVNEEQTYYASDKPNVEMMELKTSTDSGSAEIKITEEIVDESSKESLPTEDISSDNDIKKIVDESSKESLPTEDTSNDNDTTIIVDESSKEDTPSDKVSCESQVEDERKTLHEDAVNEKPVFERNLRSRKVNYSMNKNRSCEIDDDNDSNTDEPKETYSEVKENLNDYEEVSEEEEEEEEEEVDYDDDPDYVVNTKSKDKTDSITENSNQTENKIESVDQPTDLQLIVMSDSNSEDSSSDDELHISDASKVSMDDNAEGDSETPSQAEGIHEGDKEDGEIEDNEIEDNDEKGEIEEEGEGEEEEEEEEKEEEEEEKEEEECEIENSDDPDYIITTGQTSSVSKEETDGKGEIEKGSSYDQFPLNPSVTNRDKEEYSSDVVRAEEIECADHPEVLEEYDNNSLDDFTNKDTEADDEALEERNNYETIRDNPHDINNNIIEESNIVDDPSVIDDVISDSDSTEQTVQHSHDVNNNIIEEFNVIDDPSVIDDVVSNSDSFDSDVSEKMLSDETCEISVLESVKTEVAEAVLEEQSSDNTISTIQQEECNATTDSHAEKIIEISQTLSIVVNNVTEEELQDVGIVNKNRTLLAPITNTNQDECEEVKQIIKRKHCEEEEELLGLAGTSSTTPDKMIKLDTKEDLREELQKLLNQEEKNMVTLTEKIEKTTITFGKEVQEIEDEKIGYDINGKVIADSADSDTDEIVNGNGLADVELVELDEPKAVEVIGELDDKENGSPKSADVGENEFTVVKEAPTPCITRKSLRQRNRGSHNGSPLPTSNELKLNGKSSSDDEVSETKEKVATKDLFTNLTMVIKLLEGHYQDVCAVDLNGEHVVSAGRDTSVKLWSSSCKEELKSVGGHTATITGVKFMKDKHYATYPNAVSGSYDCSVRVWDLENGTQSRCIYVYSPVVCLDYRDGKVAIGTEGGKVEVYNVDTGDQLFSMKSHEDAVSAVKLLSGDKIACGSNDGVLKIFNIIVTQTEPLFVLDPTKVVIKQASEAEGDSQSKSSLSMSKITCITAWNDLVIYGDEGFNLKVLDYEKGEVVKVRNNLQEFCPTESLHVTSVQGTDCLFSVGSDVDHGDAYINIRSLPDLKYFGTIRDDHRSTGSITTFSAEENDNCIRLVTGGGELRVWDQAPRRAKKRKSASVDEDLIPCKFICNYTEARDSEPESETDESGSSRFATSSTEESQNATEQPQRWCSIL